MKVRRKHRDAFSPPFGWERRRKREREDPEDEIGEALFGLRTPKNGDGEIDGRRRRPSENHFALAARTRREAKRRRVSERTAPLIRQMS